MKTTVDAYGMEISMPTQGTHTVGHRIAVVRRLARMTQRDLASAAGISYSTVRAIERDARQPSDAVLDGIAAALAVDPSQLRGKSDSSKSLLHDTLPALSSAIATYDVPDDGPVRSLRLLHAAVDEAANWRLGAQYRRIAKQMPQLISELTRALHTARDSDRPMVAALLASAYRSADAVAYKAGARDLSARLVELMRWAATQTNDDLILATAAYVRTETFFAARAHTAGLRALQAALDATSASAGTLSTAIRGSLHMRAAVIAGRATDRDAAVHHMQEARRLGDLVPESVYHGTAFGPSSVRIHEVSVAVSLGGDHLQHALHLAREWAPSRDLSAERRSSFYIELARAQLWSGLRDDAFESMKVARHIAPQHARDHPWVRDGIATLRRLKRADLDDLSAYAAWCRAI